ncbi:MAG: hypothetical protein ACI8ZB_003358 [Desulforhopalus sp.]|jgi:hypothetical protein
MSAKTFEQQIISLKSEVESLTDNSSDDHVEEVALRLEGLNFTPPVITPIKLFVRLKNDDLIEEIERILAMPDVEACSLAPDNTKKCEDLRIQYITVLIYYYKKLLELRVGNIEEWDEVDELYVHD